MRFSFVKRCRAVVAFDGGTVRGPGIPKGPLLLRVSGTPLRTGETPLYEFVAAHIEAQWLRFAEEFRCAVFGEPSAVPV